MIDKNFLNDVDTGLTSTPKRLSSKYFYDDKGSILFQEIMNLPEYYLTNAELEIFKKRSFEILEEIGEDNLNVIELGAGDGLKSIEFLKAIKSRNLSAKYNPIDISEEAVLQLTKKFNKEIPDLPIIPHTGDYFIELEKVYTSDNREVVLFLGANIGNYGAEKAAELLQLIGQNLKQGDILLIGIDLMKDPQLIAEAYNDRKGITRKFNLNLLERINRELGGDFDLDLFGFYSHYNPQTGEVKSFLYSKADQEVGLSSNGKAYSFSKNELIYTELSKKYDNNRIMELASSAGFICHRQFHDSQGLFAECMFVKL